MVCGDRCFFLFACGVANAYKKARQQKRYTQHRAARVSRQRTRAAGIEQPEQIGEQRLSPHPWVLRWRKRVEHDHVRPGNFFGSRLAEKGGKIRQVQIPANFLFAILE